MNRERNRSNLLSALMMIVLLLAVLIFISDNNSKYSDALGRASTIIAQTQRVVNRFLTATQLAAETRAALSTPTPSPSFPYDPTLYAQRQQETYLLMTAGGPTEYAIFYATETALVATYQTTPTPS